MRKPRRRVHRPASYSAAELAHFPGIGDVAAQYGLTHRALRFYEDAGLIAPIRYLGRRYYGSDALRSLDIVVSAKKAGFSLREIEEMLRADQTWAEWLGPKKLKQRIGMLQHRLREIDNAVQELTRLLPTLPAGSGSTDGDQISRRSLCR
ncbi:MerR family transcriptional regulator [Phreatobacter sp. HK31-P]